MRVRVMVMVMVMVMVEENQDWHSVFVYAHLVHAAQQNVDYIHSEPG